MASLDIDDIANDVTLNDKDCIIVNSKTDLYRIQKMSLKRELQASTSKGGFVWFRCPTTLFEKFKEQILVVFYGKMVVENIDLDKIKMFTRRLLDSIVLVCVVNTEFVII